ncbi:hypothetical protein VE00_00263 [Pseudogymnoascus sp. WSF 3629]|jgi:phosphoadenosine phosphosulfate reductase|nr:hypothetical protein VE00_00263 [Pseudogymnoascus sp. WSF 3629]
MGSSKDTTSDAESGYASGSSSRATLPQITFTKPQLKHINSQLSRMEPLDILRWAKTTLPSLFQTTAFGLTGLVTIDLLSKLQAEDPSSPAVPLIFLDTFHHFPETLDLLKRIQARYPDVTLHTFAPAGLANAEEFETRYGPKLWETDPDQYDWVAKVELAERAYSDLGVAAVLTGRRRSQGDKRSDLGILEVDDAGLVKLNPLFNWSFAQVKAYIDENNVPYNVLLDQGYKSVGDWHSTQPVAQGEDERAGRWKGQEKTECGIHNKRSKYAVYLEEMERKAKEEAEAAAAVVPTPVAPVEIAI